MSDSENHSPPYVSCLLLLVGKKWHIYFQECYIKNTTTNSKIIDVIIYCAYCWPEYESLIINNQQFRIWYLTYISHLPFHFLCVSFCLAAPPSIIGNHGTPENISVVEKNSVSLTCEASGIPLPSITWLKDGWPISLSSSVRILSGITSSCRLIIWLSSHGHHSSLLTSPCLIFLFDLDAYSNPHWS